MRAQWTAKIFTKKLRERGESQEPTVESRESSPWIIPSPHFSSSGTGSP